MKRFALIAVSSILVFLLSACGESGNSHKQPVGTTTTPPAQNQPAGEPHNQNP